MLAHDGDADAPVALAESEARSWTMYCMSCGHEVPTNAVFCARCGAAQAGPPPAQGQGPPAARVGAGQPAPHPARPGQSTLSFDATRWSRGEMVAGAATLVLFIALFLPWFSARFGEVTIPTLSADAIDAHGWMYITLLVTLAVMGYWTAPAFVDMG
jgi:ribosomal protein L40E